MCESGDAQEMDWWIMDSIIMNSRLVILYIQWIGAIIIAAIPWDSVQHVQVQTDASSDLMMRNNINCSTSVVKTRWQQRWYFMTDRCNCPFVVFVCIGGVCYFWALFLGCRWFFESEACMGEPCRYFITSEFMQYFVLSSLSAIQLNFIRIRLFD